MRRLKGAACLCAWEHDKGVTASYFRPAAPPP